VGFVFTNQTVFSLQETLEGKRYNTISVKKDRPKKGSCVWNYFEEQRPKRKKLKTIFVVT